MQYVMMEPVEIDHQLFWQLGFHEAPQKVTLMVRYPLTLGDIAYFIWNMHVRDSQIHGKGFFLFWHTATHLLITHHLSIYSLHNAA